MARSTDSSRRVWLRGLVESAGFNTFIIAVIVLNAVLIGLSTYLSNATALGAITLIENVCVGIYLVEIVLRFLTRESSRAFFRDGWNVFDLVIVVAALVPASSSVGPILRILRVFRVLRLVKTIPELRLIVTVLVRSIASMKYVTLLAFILYYVYAIIGVKLFGTDGNPMQPYFASIHEAFFSLFRILTGDDWTQMRYELAQGGYSVTAFTAYQVSWMLIATFLLVNVLVGAVINNYQKVQDIEHHRSIAPDTSEHRLRELVDELDAILKSRANEDESALNPRQD
ncbi:MAG: ion transporter [Armatimonadetes bacterium]|nr:ion transporter [Armatimonadota bacterium]